jgi:hypothetical protein
LPIASRVGGGQRVGALLRIPAASRGERRGARRVWGAWTRKYNRLVLQPQPVTPVVVKIVEETTPEVSVADILVGAFGFVGAVLLAAAIVGVLAGGVFILFRRWREARSPDARDDVGLRLAAHSEPGPPSRP